MAYQELSGEKVTSFFGGALAATDKHKAGSNPDLLSPPRPPRPARGGAAPAAAGG